MELLPTVHGCVVLVVYLQQDSTLRHFLQDQKVQSSPQHS